MDASREDDRVTLGANIVVIRASRCSVHTRITASSRGSWREKYTSSTRRAPPVCLTSLSPSPLLNAIRVEGGLTAQIIIWSVPIGTKVPCSKTVLTAQERVYDEE